MRFRKATGHSVLDEIHDVQLARAKDLLREGTMPLKAISDFCGFENPNSLRKFFKVQAGRCENFAFGVLNSAQTGWCA